MNPVPRDRRKPQSSAEEEEPTKPTLKLIISGAPASGKGTQCEMIVNQFHSVHISTGDLLREEVNKGSELGLKAKEYMDAGELVPDEVMIDLVKRRISQSDAKENGWILDGFPRTKAQAQALQEAGIVPDLFIRLDVPDEVVIERISGRRIDPETNRVYHMVYNPPPADDEALLARLVQRSDDTEEKIVNRLRHFHSCVEEVSQIYSSLGVLVAVDGARDKTLVSEEISTLIQQVLAASSSAASSSNNNNNNEQSLQPSPHV
eukprot:GEZU01013559.1.p1 GENE.GEZU01013559.1~~GEZU01013559.1.p1  ORF type:complete len:262 (-),score=60.14 GEZU01013559.1:1033-1818(-)